MFFVAQECFVYEELVSKTKWVQSKVIDGEGDQLKSAESMDPPKGWEWEDDWAVDTKRACDEDGKMIFGKNFSNRIIYRERYWKMNCTNYKCRGDVGPMSHFSLCIVFKYK